MDKAQDVERSVIKKYRKQIWRPFITAVSKYALIGEGDAIAVCISGGKDSMLLAKCIQELARHGRHPFRAEYIVMDPGYSAADRQRIVDSAAQLGIPIRLFETNIFDVAFRAAASHCYLCARMRRGHLYRYAQQLGCNKIALGHHFDDVIETILLNLLYTGQIRTMMPKLRSTNFPGMELIRPLYHVRENDIMRFWRHHGQAFIRCACRFTQQCASEDDHASKRQEVKALIGQLRHAHPLVDKSIFASLQNINLETVVAYRDKDGFHSFLDHYDG